MKILKIWYQPEGEVEFTWAEVAALILYSESHYDYKCKEMSTFGGVLRTMQNRFNLPLELDSENDEIRRNAKITVRLDGYTADLLAKVAECDPYMGRKMQEVSRKINDAWTKINKDNL